MLRQILKRLQCLPLFLPWLVNNLPDEPSSEHWTFNCIRDASQKQVGAIRRPDDPVHLVNPVRSRRGFEHSYDLSQSVKQHERRGGHYADSDIVINP